METTRTNLINKAAGIIINKGLEELTIYNLAKELDVQEPILTRQFSKDEDIILALLHAFETDFIEFVTELKLKKENPESELKILFKGLYFLFLQKPFYLSLIFDKNLAKRDTPVKNAILHIKCIAEEYLQEVINKGKTQNTFRTNEPTRLLVKRILSEYRMFMKDEQRMSEIIRELKSLKKLND